MKKLSEMSLGDLEEMKKDILIKEITAAEEAKNLKSSGPASLVPSMPMSKEEDNKFVGYFKRYVGDNYIPYAMTDSNEGCITDVSSWSPSENFVAAIWSSVMSSSRLLGVANVGFDVHAGAGNRIDIRCIGDFGAPTVIDSCECISCGSAALSTYSLVLSQLGLGSVLCNFELHDVGYSLFAKVVEGMSRSYTKYFDGELFDALDESAAEEIVLDGALSLTPSLASAGCCEDESLYHLYNGIVKAIIDMTSDSYNPDVLILHPLVAGILLRMGVPSAQNWANSVVQLDSKGQLSSFAGVKVVVTTEAGSDVEGSSATIAILIDSSRALGAAFGLPPTLKSEQNAACNSTDFYMWSYFGCGVLDIDAQRHIVTAA